MGGRSVTTGPLVSGTGVEDLSLCITSEELRSSTNRPLCHTLQQKEETLHLQNDEDESRASRCILGRLEQVGVPVPVPSSAHLHNVESVETIEVVPGQGHVDCSTMASTTLVPGTSSTVSFPSTSASGLPSRRRHTKVKLIAKATRVEFLHLVLRSRLKKKAKEDIIDGHRESTIRQYQSGWLKFQRFMKESRINTITIYAPVEFASWLFHKDYTSATVDTHLAAVADPLYWGFNVKADTRAIKLLRASFSQTTSS